MIVRGVGFLVLVALLHVAYAEQPVLPQGKGEFCVEPTDVMRKNHMKFLLHQRDKTVIEGVRTKKHSLIECVDCHVQTNSEGAFIPIDAPGQFCEACHTFASAKLDCFECHATTPDKNHSAMRLLEPGGGEKTANKMAMTSSGLPGFTGRAQLEQQLQNFLHSTSLKP